MNGVVSKTKKRQQQEDAISVPMKMMAPPWSITTTDALVCKERGSKRENTRIQFCRRRKRNVQASTQDEEAEVTPERIQQRSCKHNAFTKQSLGIRNRGTRRTHSLHTLRGTSIKQTHNGMRFYRGFKSIPVHSLGTWLHNGMARNEHLQKRKDIGNNAAPCRRQEI